MKDRIQKIDNDKIEIKFSARKTFNKFFYRHIVALFLVAFLDTIFYLLVYESINLCYLEEGDEASLIFPFVPWDLSDRPSTYIKNFSIVISIALSIKIISIFLRKYADILLTRSTAWNYRLYVNTFCEKFKNKPTLIGDIKYNQKEPYFSHHFWVQNVDFQNSLSHIFDGVVTLLSSLTVIIFAITNGYIIATAWWLGIILSTIMMFISLKKTKKLAYELQKARTDWTKQLNKGWQTILSGNEALIERWKNDNFVLEKAQGDINRKIIRRNSWHRTLVYLYNAFSCILSFSLIIFFKTFSLQELIIICAMLPKLFDTIKKVSDMYEIVIKHIILSVRYKTTYEKVSLTKKSNFGSINYSHIKFNGHNFENFEQLWAFILKNDKKIITIKSAYNSGVSSLMRYIKQTHEKVFLFPNINDFYFGDLQEHKLFRKDVEKNNGKNKIFFELTTIYNLAKKGEIKLLLLDGIHKLINVHNKKTLMGLIEKISQYATVITTTEPYQLINDENLKLKEEENLINELLSDDRSIF